MALALNSAKAMSDGSAPRARPAHRQEAPQPIAHAPALSRSRGMSQDPPATPGHWWRGPQLPAFCQRFLSRVSWWSQATPPGPAKSIRGNDCDIYRDVQCGLTAYEAGMRVTAIWESASAIIGAAIWWTRYGCCTGSRNLTPAHNAGAAFRWWHHRRHANRILQGTRVRGPDRGCTAMSRLRRRDRLRVRQAPYRQCRCSC